MNAQQLHDYIIKPTLQYMGGNYYSKDAAMLLLATAAIESDCGHYIHQIGGPALGIWQMEPDTSEDIWKNCDALNSMDFIDNIGSFCISRDSGDRVNLIVSPMYACAMARLKYSMDSAALPDHNNIASMYNYYKRIYNTHFGASTATKFNNAWFKHGLDKVEI